ncbi:MAG TPA: hypothetical protein VLE99_05160 [Candidatus Saccharimonadales bacterium]|nr:hypothetical protein [Candidatus Saccharimonadales bacterium]
MDEQKQKLTDRIKQAQNVLVTVSSNPTVDQLAAAIGLTLALNKLDKHGTAVFSGQIPSTIEFLKPEDTLEKDTNSLRDFIIALDKSKADKLRYKVEDQVVRIFITPYKTSLSESDLEFSQGDFNVDVVIALGVTEQQDLDAAITAHGRILHDATVASVTTTGQGSLGTINWIDTGASSLCEMMVALTDGLDKKILDSQISTAYLTGIVANTQRFSNEKTAPKTMSAAAELMAAGANQQLIATQLETSQPAEPAAESHNEAAALPVAEPPREPGELDIDHADEEPEPPATPEPAPEAPKEPQINVDENGQLLVVPEAGQLPERPHPEISGVHGVDMAGQPTDGEKTEVKRERLVEPPKLGDADLTANISPEGLDPSTEELTLPPVSSPLLTHNQSVLTPAPPPLEPAADPYIPQAPLSASSPMAPPALSPEPPMIPPVPGSVLPPTPAPVTPPSDPAAAAPPPSALFDPVLPDTTLSQIEQSVDSPHVHISDDGVFSTDSAAPPAPPVSTTQDVDNARSAVEAALNAPDAPAAPLPAMERLNATPLGPDLHPAVPVPPAPVSPAPPAVPNTGFSEPTPGNTPADDALDMPLPSNPFGPGQQATPLASPSSFPGMPPAPGSGTTPPPPVPPPMLPPLQ